jgi:hypothetical protein
MRSRGPHRSRWAKCRGLWSRGSRAGLCLVIVASSALDMAQLGQASASPLAPTALAQSPLPVPGCRSQLVSGTLPYDAYLPASDGSWLNATTGNVQAATLTTQPPELGLALTDREAGRFPRAAW